MKDKETDTAPTSTPFLGSRSAVTSTVEPATSSSSVNCEASITQNPDLCNNQSSEPYTGDMAANNKVSMENLVPEPGFRKVQRSLKIWQLVSLLACVFAVVMLALFIWQLTLPRSASESSMDRKSKASVESWPAAEHCPQLPPLLTLPSPLPHELNTSLEKIDEYLKGLINSESHLPAISANIFYKDKIIWKKHYGRKKANEPEGPDDNTFYRIGSISKVFPVIMIYKMYEEGLIGSLDDPLYKYAPDFHINNPFTRENITLRQIANQLSGLPREAPCVICVHNETTESQLRLLRNRSLVVEPGTYPSYSNLGYALLGRLLTVNTTFEKWVKDNILTPWGLNDTGFQITKEVQQNMAFPHSRSGEVVEDFMNIGWLSPSGQMYSTSNDMAKFGMYLNGAKKQSMLKMKHLREMMAPSSIAADGQTLWGSPWEMIFHKHFLVRGKGGAVDSYAAMLSVVPEVQLGFSAFINVAANFSNGALIANTIMDFAYRNFLPAFNKTLFELNEKAEFPVNATMYTGYYNVTEVDEITGIAHTPYQANISTFKTALKYRNSKGQIIYLRYINEELILQAKREPNTCFIDRIGTIADFYFSPPANSYGLSPSFTVPGWGMTGVRISEERNPLGRMRRRAAFGDESEDRRLQQDSVKSFTGPLGPL